MKLVLSTLGATLLLTASAVCQVALPPHASTYNGYSRGFSFTAINTFIIQSLDLPVDAMQAGDTAGYRLEVNSVEVFYSVGNTGAVTVTPALIINPGDIVAVVGNWSPSVTGNFTAHNSYGAGGGTYSTNIEGVAHILYRAGVQWDIGDPGYAAAATFNGIAGSVGRIEMYTSQTSGLFASFTSDVQTGPSPLLVNFTDTSFTSDPGGIIAWAWDFENDGTVDSSLQNPTHTYPTCGVFDVSLQVFDSMNPSSTMVEVGFIATDTVTADFTSQVIGPLVVQFTDTSVGPATTWAWDLNGDGTIDTTIQNPAFVYPNANSVQVSLTVTRMCSAPDTITRTVFPVPCIETTFANNNAGGAGWTMYFDCDVTNPKGIEITAVDVHLSTTGISETVEIYVGSDTYLGNEMNADNWKHVATGTGMSMGAGTPSSLTLSNTIYLPRGDYAFAMIYSAGMPYTNGNGANQTVSNGDLTLNLGIARSTTLAGGPFGAATSTFTPRVWNGRICYEICQVSSGAGYGFAGAGCPGSVGIATLSSSAEPIIGSTITVDIGNMPDIGGGLTGAILMTGLSNTTSALGPLPFDVTAFGAPGCLLRVSPDMNLFLLGNAGSASWSLTIPNDPGLACTLFYQQAVVIDPGFNAAGAIGSEAAGMLIGN